MSTFDRLDVLAMVSTVMYSREKESGSWTPTTETTDQESLSMMESSELEEYEYTTPIPTKTLQGDDQQYWMDPQWVPTNANGKQKTPNSIRSDLAAFMDANKFSRSKVISALGVNPNSFRKFMQHKYADQWRATENGTYWAAARLVRCFRFPFCLDGSDNTRPSLQTGTGYRPLTPAFLLFLLLFLFSFPVGSGVP